MSSSTRHDKKVLEVKKTDEKSYLGHGAEGPHIRTWYHPGHIPICAQSLTLRVTPIRGLASKGAYSRNPNLHRGGPWRLGPVPSGVQP